MMDRGAEQKAGRSHQVYEEEKATFVKTLSWTVLRSQSHIWYPCCLNIGFFFCLIRPPPWSHIWEEADETQCPSVMVSNWKGCKRPLTLLPPEAGCVHLLLLISSSADQLLTLHLGNILPPGKWGKLACLSSAHEGDVSKWQDEIL